MAVAPTERPAHNADLPSSPPPLPTREPSLPSVKRQTSTRLKRLHSDLEYNNSSDPALFSSDELEASVDNYASQRSKKICEGPWFKDHKGANIRGYGQGQGSKKRLTRNYDSGIWMGSESSSFGSDIPSDLVSDNNEPLAGGSGIIVAKTKHVQPPQLSPVEEAHLVRQEEASEYVHSIVEKGQDVVDLTGRNLQEIDGELLKPLRLLIRQPRHQHPPAWEDYHPLKAHVRLFLGQNDLASLPHEIYTLKNLAELSLRNNRLSTLLPHICHLNRLEALNLSANCFNYLPDDLRLMMQGPLNTRLHPNPYFSPIYNAFSKLGNPTWSKDQSIIATSSICYLSVTGHPISGSSPAPSRTPHFIPSSFQSSPTENSVPSLVELCLRTAGARTSNLKERPDGSYSFVPDKDYRYLIPSLQTLARANAFPDTLTEAISLRIGTGFLSHCAVCHRQYGIARAEWLEWWLCEEAIHPVTDETEPYPLIPNLPLNLPEDGEEEDEDPPFTIHNTEGTNPYGIPDPLPFLVRACSWQCAADRVTSGPFMEGKKIPEGAMNCGWSLLNPQSSGNGKYY